MLSFYPKFKGRYIQFIFLLFIFSLSARLSFAQSYSLPSTSSTGSYTISYSATATIGLIEELQSGTNTWQTIGGGQKSGSIPVVKTVSGTYTYRMKNCMGTQSGLSCSTVPGTRSIVVSLVSSSSSVSSSPGPLTTSYIYDELGRIKSVTYPNGAKNSYEYDAADNRTKKETTPN